MDLRVERTRALKGRVRLPASKSYSIRAFLIAACGGRSRVFGPSDCDDARVARKVAGLLGARVQRQSKSSWSIEKKSSWRAPRQVHVGESGTVLRFVLPLLALSPHPCQVTGKGTLRGRPNHHLTEVLRRQGVRVRGTGSRESIPIKLSGGTFRGGPIRIEGSLSSQFISALLIACPLLSEDTRITIRGRQVVSADYINMTELVLKKAGVRIRRMSPRVFRVKGRQIYRGLGTFTVPSDYGLAAFLMAAGVLTSSQIRLEGAFRDEWPQADGHIFSFLRQMDVRVTRSPRMIKITGPVQLQGGRFSLKDCPDLLPIMAVLALFAEGPTRLVHIRHARIKESNRVSDLRRELLKIGADVQERENELIIRPNRQGEEFFYRGGMTLDSYQDHRLAMAWSVLGLRCGVRVKGIESVSKSYPAFVRDLRSLGGKCRISR